MADASCEEKTAQIPEIKLQVNKMSIVRQNVLFFNQLNICICGHLASDRDTRNTWRFKQSRNVKQAAPGVAVCRKMRCRRSAAEIPAALGCDEDTAKQMAAPMQKRRCVNNRRWRGGKRTVVQGAVQVLVCFLVQKH